MKSVKKLTQPTIKAVQTIDGKRTEYRIMTNRGNPMPGLVLEVLPSGKKIFRFRHNGRKMKIGEGHTDLKGVSELFWKLRHAIDAGRDPWAEREAKKKTAQRDAFTVSEFGQ